ncbi:MAG: desulfoferrodoxin [Clostridia bacterium]|nr:desulfoferrodoxin [Clostridia bacterium]
MEQKFYICKHCGNIITYVKSSGVPVVCCGENMQEITPGSVDAAHEKHIPVISTQGNKVVVTVGEVDHPMIPEHFIEWIFIQTKQGNQRKKLSPNTKPVAEFAICDGDEVVCAYAYCNLHGLWKK